MDAVTTEHGYECSSSDFLKPTLLQLIPAVKELLLNFLQLMYIVVLCSGDTR